MEGGWGLELRFLVVGSACCTWNYVNHFRILVFCLRYFDGVWLLIHLQRRSGRGYPYSMVHKSHWDNIEWHWQRPHWFECVHSCVPGRVTTFLQGVWRVCWWKCLLCVLGDHWLISQMVWNVSVDPVREGSISSYFNSLVLPTPFQGIGWDKILHLYLSLWHQWGFQFSVFIDEKHEDILFGPSHFLAAGWL